MLRTTGKRNHSTTLEKREVVRNQTEERKPEEWLNKKGQEEDSHKKTSQRPVVRIFSLLIEHSSGGKGIA